MTERPLKLVVSFSHEEYTALVEAANTESEIAGFFITLDETIRRAVMNDVRRAKLQRQSLKTGERG